MEEKIKTNVISNLKSKSTIEILHKIKIQEDLNLFMKDMLEHSKKKPKCENTLGRLFKSIGITIIGCSKDELLIDDGKLSALINFIIVDNERIIDYNTLSII